MVESFSYTSQIQETASRIVDEMLQGTTNETTRFIALHVRHQRRPALDCQGLGLSPIVRDKKKKNHTKAGCTGVDWKNVLSKVFPNMTAGSSSSNNNNNSNKSTLVFVAHDSRIRLTDLIPAAAAAAAAAAAGILSDQNFIWKDISDFDHIVSSFGPAIVSAIEQEIAIRAEYFIGSIRTEWNPLLAISLDGEHSSWSASLFL
jgi:hypothetical protein